nr:hypothetical protein HK105_002567 [Polyrhizophydium stewartii]
MFPSFILAISAAVAGFGATVAADTVTGAAAPGEVVGAIAADAVTGAPADALLKFRSYAGAARCDVVTTNGQWTCGPNCQGVTAGTTVFRNFNNGDTGTGLVAVQPSSKSIVVIFRGSTSLADWFTDLQFGQENASWVQLSWAAPANLGSRFSGNKLAMPTELKLHGGFQKIYLGVRDKVQTAIADALAKNPGFTINFVGHSLGGALASIAAVDYLNLHGTSNAANTFIYTYGQPRTGNKAWANFVSSLPFGGDFRLTKHNDPVPHLPPSAWSFRHSTQEYRFTTDNNILACTNTGDAGEVENCSGDIFQWWAFDFNAHANGYFDT